MTTCPTQEQMLAAVMALVPRGRAWQTSPFASAEDTVQRRFWAALADIAFQGNSRLCVLVNEFFCETASETLDLWALEYGLPDACDPFADLCAKVDALGDTTPDYAEAAALLRGWSVSIEQQFITASMSGYAGLGMAGASTVGAEQGVTWLVTIDTDSSPAFEGVGEGIPYAGLMMAGEAMACTPDIDSLECVLRRIAPAQVDLVFQTI